MSAPTPKIGRNARLVKDGVVIGLGRNIRTETSAESNEGHSMDSVKPAFSEPGNQTFSWSAEKFYVDGAYLTLLLNGTKFALVFAPTGSPTTAPYETWTGCYLTNVGRDAGMKDGIIEQLKGKALDVTVHDS